MATPGGLVPRLIAYAMIATYVNGYTPSPPSTRRRYPSDRRSLAMELHIIYPDIEPSRPKEVYLIDERRTEELTKSDTSFPSWVGEGEAVAAEDGVIEGQTEVDFSPIEVEAIPPIPDTGGEPEDCQFFCYCLVCIRRVIINSS